MKSYICTTCGTRYPPAESKPDHCPICEEERQYVNAGGQEWTTAERLKEHHRPVIRKKEENLYGIGSTPAFAIGQRALLVRTPAGNILWDCISLIEDTLVDLIGALGGLEAIAISHPHYYTSMAEWSRLFGNIPVYLHRKDREWVQNPHENITFWSGDSRKLLEGITLYNTGGHFRGGAILHWEQGAKGEGALLTGDILQVVADRKHVSFMYSYPNLIPLNARSIERITGMLKPLNYDRIYGAWWDRNILAGAQEAVRKSSDRYIKAIQ